MQVDIIAYKGRGRIGDWLIRLWTWSKYSHVELRINGIGYTSMYGIGVNSFDRKDLSGDWDVFPVDCTKGNVMDMLIRYNKIKHQPYDVVGVAVGQLLKTFRWHKKDEWFCSEVVAYMLGLEHPERYAPKDTVTYITCGKVR